MRMHHYETLRHFEDHCLQRIGAQLLCRRSQRVCQRTGQAVFQVVRHASLYILSCTRRIGGVRQTSTYTYILIMPNQTPFDRKNSCPSRMARKARTGSSRQRYRNAKAMGRLNRTKLPESSEKSRMQYESGKLTNHLKFSYQAIACPPDWFSICICFHVKRMTTWIDPVISCGEGARLVQRQCIASAICSVS